MKTCTLNLVRSSARQHGLKAFFLQAALAAVFGGTSQAAASGDPGKPMPRFYIGLQVARFRFAGLGQYDADGHQLSYRGTMPVIGYRFNSRVGVEAAALWRGRTAGEMTVVNYPYGGVYRYYDSFQSWLVPFVVRVALLPRSKLWNVEGVAGISLLHSLIEGNRSNTEAGQPLQPFEVGGFTQANDVPLALGLGLTYELAPHWTISGEGRLNWSLLGSAARQAFGGRPYTPQLGISAGLRYNFNIGKR